MDCRAVIILLCLLDAQAACGPVRHEAKTGALKAIFQLMRVEIRIALGRLAAPGLLPNTSCTSLNTTELLQPLAAHDFSSFRCHMLKVSELTPELSPQLLITSQHTLDVERLMSVRTADRNCSLPAFEQDMDSYVYVKCLLDLLDQRLSF